MKAKVLCFISLWLLSALACSTVAFPAPDPTAIPIVHPTSTDKPSFTLTPLTSEEEGHAPPYKITTQLPAILESDDPRASAFNTLIHDLVMGEVKKFKDNTLLFASNPPITNGSTLDIQYSLIGQAGNFWSIKFDIAGYSDGAAHPYHYSITVNYDLEQGREIALDEIFLANSNYLQKISEYCKAELATRDIAFDMFAQGADPTPENYQRWNLSDEGLVITFDEYQVAPYAAGPQVVVIPFAELEGLINGQGPLAPFLP